MPKTKLKAKAKKTVVARKASKKKSVRKTAQTRVKKKVLAIPKGYHNVTPYLIIDGAAAAIAFYQKVFGAKAVFKMERNDKKVAHAELKIGDSKIMLADECPEWQAHSPKAFGGSPMNIHLYVKNADKIVDRAVAAGAKLLKPVENMFYGDRCGRIEDPFGYQWHVSTHVENVSTRELKKRAAQMYPQK
jgi:PhnB protein